MTRYTATQPSTFNNSPNVLVAKLNSLVDEDIIQALYDASCPGVKIELIIRGICCLNSTE